MRLIRDLPHNAKYTLALEPLWAIFSGMIFFYAPLYMRELGLTEIEMGFVNTVNLVCVLGCQLMAAPVTNRMGRKRTTLVVDIVSWTIPMLIWATAQGFWFFVVAYAINAGSKITSVSWYCLVSEDAPKEAMPKVFMILYTLVLASGIFTPVTGILIAKFGTVSTLRSLYFFGMLSMTAMFLLRDKFVMETSAGHELMHKHNEVTFLQSLRIYGNTLALFCKQKSFALYTAIFILSGLVLSFNFYQVLYMTEALGFGEQEISYIPLVSAVSNMAVYFMVLPWLRRLRDESSLVLFVAVSAAGALMFVCAPAGNLWLLLVSTMLVNVGFTLVQSYRDACFVNWVGSTEKADALSAVQMLNTIVCIPAAAAAGFFYASRPALPFLLNFGAFLLMLGVSTQLLGKHSNKKENGHGSAN